MIPLAPQDAMFLLAESRQQPMHVGGLQLFVPPDDAGPDYLPELYEQLLSVSDVAPLFRRRVHRSLATLGQWVWVDDDEIEIDLEHHVRHSALPRPGRIRELLALTSRLHGSLLDRQRPLWEGHLVEGLADGRFAVYTKVHHAMMDGVSALRLLQRSLSPDPDARDVLAPWAPRPDASTDGGGSVTDLPAAMLRSGLDLAGLGPAMLRRLPAELRERALTLPHAAPRTVFNVSVTGARRFAAESWPLERLREVGAAAGGTVNDVVLAMCAGALRAYLLELDALPDDPLIAMTPVSLRAADDQGGGNAVATILCNLGTHLADPAVRLAAIRRSMNHGKSALSGLSPLQATAVSSVVMAPLALGSIGAHRLVPPPFNLVISNVPGPREPLYWNGARLAGLYPLSIPMNGQALNITVTSTAGELHFGLTGCRRSVPHLQRILGHLEDALADLEKAVVD